MRSFHVPVPAGSLARLGPDYADLTEAVVSVLLVDDADKADWRTGSVLAVQPIVPGSARFVLVALHRDARSPDHADALAEAVKSLGGYDQSDDTGSVDGGLAILSWEPPVPTREAVDGLLAWLRVA